MQNVMPTGAFWSIVDGTVSANRDAQTAALDKALAEHSPETIALFDATYRQMLDRACRWDLWAAAFVIQDGCSDDGFDYFCDWLISRGRKVFEAALADPESLADLDSLDEPQFEEFRYVAQEAYARITRSQLPLTPSKVAGPVGTPFDEATVHERYPRLAGDGSGRTPPHVPEFTAANAKAFDAQLADLVGRRMSSLKVERNSTSFRTNSEVSLYFTLGEKMLRAKAWTAETTDGNVLRVTEFVGSRLPDARPATSTEDGLSDEQVEEATRNPFEACRQVRITVRSVSRVDDASVRLEFDNAPLCRSITLYGFDDGQTGSTFGVQLRNGDQTYCLSGLGVEVKPTPL